MKIFSDKGDQAHKRLIGQATAKNNHIEGLGVVISDTFIPNTAATKLNGRKR